MASLRLGFKVDHLRWITPLVLADISLELLVFGLELRVLGCEAFSGGSIAITCFVSCVLLQHDLFLHRLNLRINITNVSRDICEEIHA